MKLVCNLVHMHSTFKNNHNYIYIYIYIYINCLLIDYELKKQIEINI